MKKTPQEEKLLQNLKPSKFSSEGFLGTDTRSIEEIIAKDLQTLAAAGIAKETLVRRLKELYLKVKNSFGAEITVASDTTARFYESMGRIPSPFRGDGVFEKGEVRITNNSTKETVILTSLSIHLIDKHDFFQGTGSRYRIDPAQIIRLLAITPD